MMILDVGNKEYKVKFSFNSFCDTDLLDRTAKLIDVFQSGQTKNDKDVYGMGRIKDLLLCVRDLLFVGFQKYNPVATVQEIGDILDDYNEDSTTGEKRSILDLFSRLTEELMYEGFLGEILSKEAEKEEKEIQKIPQDHKKKQN